VVECWVADGRHTSGSYVQGFTVPMPSAEREAYREMAEDAWAMFKGSLGRRCVRWQRHRLSARREGRAGREGRLLVHGMAVAQSLRRCAAAPRSAIADPLRFAVAIKALPYRWPAALRRRVPCCSVCVDHAGAQRSVISYGR